MLGRSGAWSRSAWLVVLADQEAYGLATYFSGYFWSARYRTEGVRDLDLAEGATALPSLSMVAKYPCHPHGGQHWSEQFIYPRPSAFFDVFRGR